MLFIAEAYWEREWDLQQQGFEYCYDKRLYDRWRAKCRGRWYHLLGDLSFQNRLVRFIENHDEPRAAAVFVAGKLARRPSHRNFAGRQSLLSGAVRGA